MMHKAHKAEEYWKLSDRYIIVDYKIQSVVTCFISMWCKYVDGTSERHKCTHT